jgi:hypothetical protein
VGPSHAPSFGSVRFGDVSWSVTPAPTHDTHDVADGGDGAQARNDSASSAPLEPWQLRSGSCPRRSGACWSPSGRRLHPAATGAQRRRPGTATTTRA